MNFNTNTELAIILLGSNESDRLGNLKLALDYISVEIALPEKISAVYSTSAWGITDQPDFLNMVIGIKTNFNPFHLLEILLGIEEKMGRTRGTKWGPRLIDLDILYYGNLMLNDSRLTLPHPGIPMRRFTLVPLCEVYPDFIHPELSLSQKQLLANCKDSGEVSVFNTHI